MQTHTRIIKHFNVGIDKTITSAKSSVSITFFIQWVNERTRQTKWRMNDSGKETACLLYCCVFSLLHHFVVFIIFILFLCNAVLHYSVWFVQMKHNALIRNKSFNEIMFFNGNTETATTKNRMIRLSGGAVGVGVVSKCNGMRERRPKFFFV